MLTTEQVDALNAARTALTAISKQARSEAYQHPSSGGKTVGEAYAQDYARVEVSADVAEHALFMLLNIASSHNVTALTEAQVHNRPPDEAKTGRVFHGTAEAVRITSDEQGFELHILTADGWHIYNIHAEAEELTRQCAKIDDYLAEMNWARQTRPPRLTEEDLEGYDLGDPKRITLQRMIDEGRPA